MIGDYPPHDAEFVRMMEESDADGAEVVLAVCVDADDLEGMLEHGWTYAVERLPLGALRVFIDDVSPSFWIVCCGDRFEISDD